MIHVSISALYKLFACVFTSLSSFLAFFFFFVCFPTCLLPDLSITPCGIEPFHFEAGGCKRRPSLALVYLFIL